MPRLLRGKKMKKNLLTLIGVVLVTFTASSPALANKQHLSVNYARVIGVEPIYRYVNIRKPHKHCSYTSAKRSYNRQRQQRRFVSGEYYGGNRINTGVGQRGNNERNFRQNRNQIRTNNRNRNHRVKHCVITHVSHKERRHDGYYVTYVYGGSTYKARTDYHPGNRIKVSVEILPH